MSDLIHEWVDHVYLGYSVRSMLDVEHGACTLQVHCSVYCLLLRVIDNAILLHFASQAKLRKLNSNKV